MERIPLLDLGAQHGPLTDDLCAAAARVLTSGRFILGPEVTELERELGDLLGVPEVVGLSSGTDALLALLSAIGVGPGDEVVTTPYSFFATVEAIVRLGAKPVFADVEPETMNLEPAAALRRVGPRTKAMLVVHLFGRAARTEALRAAGLEAGIPLLEDAAQALAATGVGTGAGTAFSFFPSKNLGGFGDGGAVATRDARAGCQPSPSPKPRGRGKIVATSGSGETFVSTSSRPRCFGSSCRTFLAGRPSAGDWRSGIATFWPVFRSCCRRPTRAACGTNS